MRNRSTKGGVILEIILFILAAGLLFKATAAGIETYKLKHLPELSTTEGTVRSVTNHGYTIGIEFTVANKTVVDIQQYVFNPQYVQGQKVPVLYNSAQPGQAVLKDKWAQWFWTITLGVPGFLILCWAMKIFTTRNL